MPGTNPAAPFHVGALTLEAFNGVIAALRAKVETCEGCDSVEQVAQGRLADLAQTDGEFLSAAVAQGRALYPEGSVAREWIDTIPQELSTVAPLQAEITAAISPAAGALHLEFQATHATSFAIPHRLSTAIRSLSKAACPAQCLYFARPGRYNRDVNQPALRLEIAISILAGGRSLRMGRNKARLRFRGRSLLAHVRAAAGETGWRVRVIRRDVIARCGPLGGIYTALKSSRAGAELFLACDMPFVSSRWLMALSASFGPRRDAVFSEMDGVAGFPFLLSVSALPIVEQQIQSGLFSLQALAEAMGAKRIRVPESRRLEVFNINTPQDWREAQRRRRTGN
jgi:molybdopterin-guanine dinucleotide biosynthesis protein A